MDEERWLKNALCLYLPHSSYEIGHTWTPSPTRATLDTLRDSMRFSLKVYLTFYTVSCLLIQIYDMIYFHYYAVSDQKPR